MEYADAEKLLVAFLRAEIGLRVVTELPSNLEEVLPVIQVSRYGGNDSRYVLDRASVDVDCFAATRAEASALAAQARELFIFRLPSYNAGAVSVSRVRTINAPGWAPYDNDTLRRFHASYMVTLHNH